MRERHHIYNFHIGFWGSLLMSLAIMVQTAVFLVMSSAATLAQTAPIVVTSPVNAAQFEINVPVTIQAQTATPSFSNVNFTVIDTATGQPVGSDVVGQSADLRNWSGSWTPQFAGNFSITASNGQISSAPVNVVVNAQITVSVTITNPSTNGQILILPSTLTAMTNVPVDGVSFILTDGGTVNKTFVATDADGQKKSWVYSLTDSDTTAGNFQIVARANISTQTTDSTPTSVVIQLPAVSPTVDLTTPLNQATLTGPVVFSAQTNQSADSVQFVLTGITGTPTNGVIQNITGTTVTGSNVWTNSPAFNTTTVPNGSYSLIASATFAGQATPIFSQNLAVTVNNVVQTTQPLAIQTTALPAGTVGVAYSGLLVATGGTLPYTWSIINGALPTGITLQGGAGTLAGTPTTANTFTVTFQVRDGQTNTQTLTIPIVINAAATVPPTTNPPAPTNPTNPTPPPTTPTAPTAPVPPTVATVISIQSPAVGATISGTTTIVVQGNVPIFVPQVRLLNSANQNVLGGTTNRAIVDSADQTVWNYVLNTVGLPNGSYRLMAVARAQGSTADTLSEQVTITVQNEEKPASTFTGGTITAPIANQKVSGRVLLNARINGTIKSLIFKVSTSIGATDVVARQQTANASIWEGSWDSATVPAGAFSVSATVETDTGEVVTLPAVQANIVATTVPLLVAPVPVNVPTAPIEQIVQPEILQNVNANGTLAQTPVECQIVAIRDEVRCAEYLRSREIRLLTTAEQEKVRQDLGPIVTRHIDLQNGFALTKGDTEQQRLVEDPLSEIIPIDKKAGADTSFLVVSSTEPPSNLKPFVMQTVPAVLTFDRDGDSLSDEAEARYGTDPMLADTDGDGFDDGTEIKNGFNPLGAGVLAQQVAPIDEAILNKRPIEQPRFAGAIADDIDVADVSSPAGAQGFTMRGKADPYAFVTLYVYSSMPIVMSIQADANGDWIYTFEDPLVDGKHDVYATVTNNTGKIVKKSEPLAFFVRGAQAVSEEQFLATSTISDASSQFIFYYILAGGLIILLGGGLFFVYLRRKEHFI